MKIKGFNFVGPQIIDNTDEQWLDLHGRGEWRGGEEATLDTRTRHPAHSKHYCCSIHLGHNKNQQDEEILNIQYANINSMEMMQNTRSRVAKIKQKSKQLRGRECIK